MSDKSKLYVTDTKIDNYEKSNYIKKIDDLSLICFSFH